MKRCIFTLADHIHSNRVNVLIKNLNEFFVEKNKDTDLLIFHEKFFNKQVVSENYNGRIIYVPVDLYDVPTEKLENISDNYRGFSIGYRMMCRFFSGIVFKILKNYDYEYALRLDTDSSFYEIVDRDLFCEFKNNDSSYGYINVQNDRTEVRTDLMTTTINYIQKNNLDTKVSLNDTILHQYNLIYYNNFEMLKLSEFVKKGYNDYFEYLDSTNGFLKYRWGDAAVRFLYVNLLMGQEKIHYFKDLAYFHHEKYKNRPFVIRDLYLSN